jgi:hypothetical protein
MQSGANPAPEPVTSRDNSLAAGEVKQFRDLCRCRKSMSGIVLPVRGSLRLPVEGTIRESSFVGIASADSAEVEIPWPIGNPESTLRRNPAN